MKKVSTLTPKCNPVDMKSPDYTPVYAIGKLIIPDNQGYYLSGDSPRTPRGAAPSPHF